MYTAAHRHTHTPTQTDTSTHKYTVRTCGQRGNWKYWCVSPTGAPRVTNATAARQNTFYIMLNNAFAKYMDTIILLYPQLYGIHVVCTIRFILYDARHSDQLASLLAVGCFQAPLVKAYRIGYNTTLCAKWERANTSKQCNTELDLVWKISQANGRNILIHKIHTSQSRRVANRR